LVLGFPNSQKTIFQTVENPFSLSFLYLLVTYFMGAIIKGDGTLSGVFGNEIQDYLASIIGNFGLWVTLIVAIALYFILEFNSRPSSIQAKYDAIKDKFSTEEYDADEDFEADKITKS
jgi:S-DNA-T family DNA segregation ATPase FtsK/SpoIIIE